MLTRLSSLFVTRLFPAELKRRVALAVRALDDATDRQLTASAEGRRDRYAYDRREVLADALAAWRVNPLARRIVGLTSQYVVGAGIRAESKHTPTHKFIQSLWHHRLNRLDTRAMEWCDELTRTGNLFVILSTDASGMTYFRALPTDNVDQIVPRPNDIEQAQTIIEKRDYSQPAAATWPAYDESTDYPDDAGSFPAVVVHYAVNRPVGAQWGESDLAPMLKWLSRYASWLEDRVRLNHFRQLFLFVVRGAFDSTAEKIARQNEINANPPQPGSVLVTDANESWDVIHPKLDSFEASEDGLSVKKMIAVGSGNPLHFLGEPESSTRTTAEAAGGPTFRHYQQRQTYFLWLIKDLLQIAIRRRRQVHRDHGVSNIAEITVTGTDISARDNASLAVASTQINAAWGNLYERGLVDEYEYLRILYAFAGENADIKDLAARARPTRPTAPGTDAKTTPPPRPDLDPDTGDLINEDNPT